MNNQTERMNEMETTSSLAKGFIQVTNVDVNVSPFGLAIVVNA